MKLSKARFTGSTLNADKIGMEKHSALYARTSTDKQEKGLEAQERALLEYCHLKQISDHESYSDEAFSGKLSSRPEFNRMLKAVRDGRIHTVVVYSFSRFARSTSQLLDSLEEFEKRNVRFISLTENIDTDSPYGKFMFTIFAAIAQLEREITVERVKNGLRNARAKGKILGTPKKIPDREIFLLHAQGVEVTQIMEKFGCSRASVYRAIRSTLPVSKT